MREHGDYRIKRFDDVVVSIVLDAWNLETMQSYASQFRALFDDCGRDPWALVVDARQWRLATPEVGPELGELARWKDRNGLVAAAYINIADDELKSHFAADQIFRHYDKARVALVEEPVDALTWVSAHGFEVSPDLQAHLR